jgi:hypothetical protein
MRVNNVCPTLKAKQSSHSIFPNTPMGDRYTGHEPERSYCRLQVPSQGNIVRDGAVHLCLAKP